MIQRIQTVFLLLAASLNAIFIFTPLFEKAFADPGQWVTAALLSALIFATALSLYSIILFNDRKKQISWVKKALVFQVVTLGTGLGVILTLGGIGSYLWDEAASWFVLLAAAVFEYLAIVFIQKDEALVQSMDRIR